MRKWRGMSPAGRDAHIAPFSVHLPGNSGPPRASAPTGNGDPGAAPLFGSCQAMLPACAPVSPVWLSATSASPVRSSQKSVVVRFAAPSIFAHTRGLHSSFMSCSQIHSRTEGSAPLPCLSLWEPAAIFCSPGICNTYIPSYREAARKIA